MAIFLSVKDKIKALIAWMSEAKNAQNKSLKIAAALRDFILTETEFEEKFIGTAKIRLFSSLQKAIEQLSWPTRLTPKPHKNPERPAAQFKDRAVFRQNAQHIFAYAWKLGSYLGALLGAISPMILLFIFNPLLILLAKPVLTGFISLCALGTSAASMLVFLNAETTTINSKAEKASFNLMILAAAPFILAALLGKLLFASTAATVSASFILFVYCPGFFLASKLRELKHPSPVQAVSGSSTTTVDSVLSNSYDSLQHFSSSPEAHPAPCAEFSGPHSPRLTLRNIGCLNTWALRRRRSSTSSELTPPAGRRRCGMF